MSSSTKNDAPHWIRKWKGISLGVCSALAFTITLFFNASTNNVNDMLLTSASRANVQVKIDLDKATALLQVPCDVETKSMVAIDHTSPLIDVIPRYSSNITIQTLAKCQGDKERSMGIEKMQSFLKYMIPLSYVNHEIISTGSSFPSLEVVPSSSDSSFTTHVALALVNSVAVKSATTKTNCNSLRGRLGKWIYNYTYGNSSWYIPANGAPMGWIRNKELTNGTYRHSSYTWESDQSISCPIELLTFRGFCEATHVLNITRIMALGDSIEFMRMVSFFHMLGIVSNVHSHLRSGNIMRYAYTFDCPSIDGSFSPVKLVFHRTNHLMPLLGNATHPSFAPAFPMFICYKVTGPQRLHPNENGWCPWVQEYIEDPAKTLIVGGIGPHFHKVADFQESFQSFLSFLKMYPRPNDIIWLRTVLAGHENCTTETTPVEPLSSFQEFREIYRDVEKEAWYGWNLHDDYNQIMEAETIKIARDRLWIGAKVELFDIFWMTALRRDGHPFSTDCLHYLLPGPPDWWNHLFYSNLRELANLS